MSSKILAKNLKLYPKYRRLSMDFLFFYTINVLFLTQIKHIDMSSVVLVDTFYALFVVLVQIPATAVVGKMGRKKGMIFGNICNAIYLILVMNAQNLLALIIAEIFCAFGFSLKDIAEPAILNESIELKSKEKSELFAKIQSKAVSGYYILSAISMVISGFLFEINGYIPIIMSLVIVFITLIVSTRFVDCSEIENEENEETKEELSLKETAKFAFKSKRCRCLLIFSAVYYSIITVLATYQITLLEDLSISSKYIGIIFALLNIVSSVSSRVQDKFQNKFKNRTMTVLGITLPAACIASGIFASLNIKIYYILIGIVCMYIIKHIMVGLYNVLLIKYLSNFTNNQIDTKIFGVNSFLSCITSAVFGLFASFLVAKYSTAMAMIIFGVASLIILVFVLIYMKNKVGLEPKKYSEYETQYESKV